MDVFLQTIGLTACIAAGVAAVVGAIFTLLTVFDTAKAIKKLDDDKANKWALELLDRNVERRLAAIEKILAANSSWMPGAES